MCYLMKWDFIGQIYEYFVCKNLKSWNWMKLTSFDFNQDKMDNTLVHLKIFYHLKIFPIWFKPSNGTHKSALYKAKSLSAFSFRVLHLVNRNQLKQNKHKNGKFFDNALHLVEDMSSWVHYLPVNLSTSPQRPWHFSFTP